ncbi:MAG: hypothetical protein AMXMBFR13_08920 [Phycisphaerae bacterium]
MPKPVWAVASLYAIFPLMAFAQHGHNHGQHGHQGHTAAKPAHAAPAQAGAAGAGALKQTTCPVTGEPIKADSFTTYEGQKVFFCCDGCIDKLKKNPARYLPALYTQLYPQRIQARCPVMGGVVDPEVFVEHKGQKVYFCCSGCDDRFKKDPAKYLPKLEENQLTQVHCPVTGGPIDLKQSLKEKDRTVYFCSKDCVAKYEANPQKFAQALLPEVGVVAYGPTVKDDIVATVCPADKSHHKRAEVQSTVYQGKVYFVSSDECAEAFQADPAKHVRALKQHKSPSAAGPQSSAAPKCTGKALSATGHVGHAGGHGCCNGPAF